MPSRRILLNFAPFGEWNLPSLGLSLLKAGLSRRGIDADLEYHTLDFARLIGVSNYSRITFDNPTRFLGEWIFMPALWGEPSPERAERFWHQAFSEHPEDAPRLLGASSERECRRKLEELQREASRYVERYVSSVDWSEYDIVGFSSAFQQGMASLALARRIKERAPSISVVFGGANCEAGMGAALLRNYAFIDHVFSGEADLTFPEFVLRHRSGTLVDEPSNGIVSRGPDGTVRTPASWVAPVEELDSLPYPDFGDYFARLDSGSGLGKVEIPFETARGCWWGQKHHCTFCGLNGSTMAYRSKSPGRAAEEILRLHEIYGDRTSRMRAVDNILDMRYFDELLPALSRLPRTTRVFFETKSNLRRDQIAALAGARITEIQPGIESLSTPVLKRMRKGCAMLQNVQTLKWCAAAGVQPFWNLIYGLPGETADAYSGMREVIPLITHLQPPIAVGPVRLDRFSPYHTAPEAWGIRNVRAHDALHHFHRFDEREVTELAYYFQYDDERDDERDVAPFLADMKRWQGSESSLVGFVTNREILIWDTREVARAEWVSVRGVDREVLLRCDSARSLSGITNTANGGPDAVKAAVERLSQHGYLLREEERYLSVVVLRSDVEPPRIPERIVTSIPATGVSP